MVKAKLADDNRSREPVATIPPDGKEQSSELDLGKRFFNARTIASFVVALVIIGFLITRVKVDFAATGRAIQSANLLYYLIALFSYYCVFPIRALRWHRMLTKSGLDPKTVPSTGRLSLIIFISWFVNCLVPAKLGDLYRAYLLRQWSGISGSKAGGTIVAERLLDLSSLLLLGGAAGLLALWGQPGKVMQIVGPLEIMAALVVVAAVGLIVMRRFSHGLIKLLPARLQGFYLRFADGATSAFREPALLIPYTLLSWVCEIARLYFVMLALNVHLSPNPLLELAMVTAVALIASLLTALPLTPAGLGFVESGIVFSLLLIGIGDEAQAFSIALLDRTISYLSLVVFGFVVYLLSARAGVRTPGQKA